MNLGDREPRVEAGTIEVGSTVAGLLLLRKLGEGSQGVVFEARQVGLDRRVAVKVLAAHPELTEEQVQRFRREAEATARMDHPNIVRLHESVHWQGHHLLVQELVTGGSLAELVEARRRDDLPSDPAWCARVADMGRQLALALHHAHENGVVHRDIKPANVLLTPDGSPKIADFGLARVDGRLAITRSGKVMGTPFYMSPEQIQGRSEFIDRRTDVYGLGAVLYTLLTLRVPFPGERTEVLFLDILTRAPEAPRRRQPAISIDLEAICLKALEKAPADRYATAADLATDLQRFLDGKPTRARPLRGLARALRASRRLATPTLALLALVATVLWFVADRLLQSSAQELDRLRFRDRLGLLAFGVIAVALPLALVGRRWAGGRRSGLLAGVALALGLAALQGSNLVEERTSRGHVRERNGLAQFLRQDSRETLHRVAGYVANWGEQFTREDRVLIARIYLLNERPRAARRWADELLAADDGDPVAWSLQEAIEIQLGNDDGARRARSYAEVTAAARSSSAVWIAIGDLRLAVHHLEDAQRAYEMAGRAADEPGQRDAINLSLAQIYTDLCDWPSAEDYRQQYLLWQSHGTAAWLQGALLAFDIERHQTDLAPAENRLNDLVSDGSCPSPLLFARQFLLLQAKGSGADAFAALLQKAYASAPTDPATVEWVGATAFATEGQLELAKLAYTRLGQLAATSPPLASWSVNASVGLSAVTIKEFEARLQAFGSADPDLVALLDFAEAQASAAIEADPAYSEGPIHLAEIVMHRLQLAHGKFDDWPASAWCEWAEPLEQALECNGVQPKILNNLAFALIRQARASGPPFDVTRPRAYAARALRLLGEPGKCKPDDARLQSLSEIYDTQGMIEETAGDIPSALAAAERALEVAPAGPFVERLQTRVALLREAAATSLPVAGH